MCVCVCARARARVCVCVYVCGVNLHVKILLKALVYMILWLNHGIMDVANEVMSYFVINYF